jgi:hypothetical protein
VVNFFGFIYRIVTMVDKVIAALPEVLTDHLSAGKYNRLLKYFADISADDLKMMTKAELVDACAPEDRLLMLSFIKTVLSVFLATDDPFDPEEAPIFFVSSATDPKRPFVSDSGALDLEARVLSSELSKVAATAGKFTIQEAFTQISPQIRKSIKSIRLGCNNLLDSDLPIVAEFVSTCTNCTFVDLSTNRFSGYDLKTRPQVDAALKSIIDSVGTVVAVYNTITSIDRADFINSLTAQQLGRFIWIPRNWLSAMSWKKMISPEKMQLIDNILDTHVNYYKR